MNNSGLSKILNESFEFQEILSCINNKVTPVNISGAADNAVAHLVFCISENIGRGALIVTADEAAANRIYDDLQLFYNDAMLFPDRELIFYDIDAATTDILSKRLTVLDRLQHSKRPIVVTTVNALLSAAADCEKYKSLTFDFTLGNEFDLSDLEEKFVNLGYSRENMVEGKGHFSIRGDIIDFFPHYSELPYRIEICFDEVDSIRTFDIETQRSVDKFDFASVTPSAEILLDAQEKAALIARLKEYRNTPDEALLKNLDKDIEKLENGLKLYSIDKYLPLIYKTVPTLLDYIDNNCCCYFVEPSRISEAVENSDIMFNESVTAYIERGIIPSLSDGWKYDYDSMISKIKSGCLIGISSLSKSSPDYKPHKNLTLTVKTQPTFHNNTDFFYSTVRQYRDSSYGVVILGGSETKAKNITYALNDEEISAVYTDTFFEPPHPGEIWVTPGVLQRGFEYPLISTAVISDRDFFGADKKKRARKKIKNQQALKSYTDLCVGDYVVHQNHGIGQFAGIKKMVIDGASADYLQIRFNGSDCLYVPTNQLDLLYKYIGKEAANIKLNKLGGSQWAQTKLKVKKSCADMAEQLISLYAARLNINGVAFSKNSEWHKDFAATFQYSETDDQLKAIAEVEADMETPRPMDRLLCGDVGYGKTEVALRAAFKAVCDGYQVAYLVPTTILASQHYNTFCQRMKSFPIKIEMLSRFRTKKEQKQTVQNAKDGTVDIIIGTHRVIQKDIEFKKLGLLIVDEEQRFGVADKEKLKELRRYVDVLTLSATPIPRTLHMSMVGIRDMSILENPPKDRYPVSTYVLEYNADIIRDAIVKEIARDGQVYYLHNKVESIEAVAAKIRRLSPDIRVAVAHGKMTETQLENIMEQVINQEVDVLVCTTIIETGLDIPNVNTIIVEDADNMGLSQLYQLRGRVGRSNRLAYAYLMYKRGKMLSEVAEKRLKAVREFTEFGSGFKIALRDLEIRGAGNVVGAQQHGHMDAVGYDMYCKLLSEAVSELKGETVAEEIQTTVSIAVDAFIPDTYISGENYRIEIYKKIAEIVDLQDSYEVYEEIEDRYGDLPQSVVNLIDISYIRSLAKNAGMSDVSQKVKNVVLTFETADKADISVISQLCIKLGRSLMFSPVTKPYLTLKTDGEILSNVKNLLQDYNNLKESTK